LKEILHDLSSTKIGPDEINEPLSTISSSALREKITIASLLKRPEIGVDEIQKLHPSIYRLIAKYSKEVAEQAEILVKYEPYIDREQKMAEKIESLNDYLIHDNFDYDRVKALSSEAREKLKKIRPSTIGQMSRISGVSPSDVSVMTIYLGK
jgi:tRNA uridine 5-carboxymethylaminomethyl modification enzyme